MPIPDQSIPLARLDEVQEKVAELLDSWLSYDPVNRILTIDGMRFTRELFSFFAETPIGTTFRIIQRDDGVVRIGEERDMRAVDLLTRISDFMRRCDPKRCWPSDVATDGEWDAIKAEVNAAIGKTPVRMEMDHG